VYTAEAKYRGHSSIAYPKKNYTLRFAKTDKFNDPAMAGGFLQKRKVCLITTFDDASYVRYRMAFELWNRMDKANIHVQHYSVVLFVNGQYFGLYALSDKLDGNLFQAQGYSENGNLFMGIDHDANFASFVYNEGNPQDQSRMKSNLSVGWEKKEGMPADGMPGALDDITSLVTFIARSSDAEFAAQAPARLNLRDYYNWFVFATAIQAFDTLGKNALHYHDPVANQPWRLVLWDFNESFGQTWQTKRFPQSLKPVDIAYVASGGVGYTNRNWLWRRFLANPTFSADLKARYGALLRNELKLETVLDAFDAMVREVAPSAARDARKWQSAQQSYFRAHRSNDFLDPVSEAAYIRKFIETRWADLLTQY
jgi:spore coat protein H